MRAKLVAALIVGSVMSACLSTSVVAAPYMCPQPQQIRCVPAVNTIGAWQANGGQMTGNTFSPNNQCANVIPLAPGKQRLLCCYEKCGVFTQDVDAKRCVKVSESDFRCD